MSATNRKERDGRHAPLDLPSNRRIFLKRFSFGMAGLLGAGAALGPLAEAIAVQVPFEPPEPGTVLEKGMESLAVSGDIPIARSPYVAYPSIALDTHGRPVVAWTAEDGQTHSISMMTFDPRKESWSPAVQVNVSKDDAPWLACQPQVAAAGEKLVFIWTETRDRAWRIVGRVHDPASGQWGETLRLAGSDDEGSVAWKPAVISLPEARVAVAWEEKPRAGRPFIVRVRCFDASLSPVGGTWSTANTAGGDCCRPSLALSPDGRSAALVYDRYEGEGTTTVHMTLLTVPPCAPLADTRVSFHPATNLAPDAVFSPDGSLIWIGWHSNASGENKWDIPRWYRVRAYNIADKQLLDPAWPPPERNLDKDSTDQGFEFVRLACAADGALCVLGRPSHRFCLQTYRGGEWSPFYRFPVEGWGGRGQFARAAFDPKGRLWVVRRDVGGNVLERIEGVAGAEPVEPVLHAFTPPATVPPLQNIDPHYQFPNVAPASLPKSDRTPHETWRIYFGDIHGHSWMSDGMGDPDESFRRARDIFHDDFHALTDHDNFVQRKLLHAEYEEQKALVDHFHEPGKFIPLYAQEWTTPRAGLPHGYGHKNLYSITPHHPLFDHKHESSQDTPALFASLSKHGMIAIPHHVAWTGTDWENHDPAVQPLAEICSVHGVFEHMGNTPIPHRGGQPGHFTRDALDRGLRFGLCGGSDQHGLIWQHGVCWKRNAYRAGITGVLARELTREAVFDAFRARRTFATTGVKLRPVLTVAGLDMGQEGTISGPPDIAVDVLALSDIKWITIVRNGEDWMRYGGEANRSRFSLKDTTVPEKRASYYYLRVELEDGNMAWTSPIWVTPST